MRQLFAVVTGGAVAVAFAFLMLPLGSASGEQGCARRDQCKLRRN